MSIKSVMFFNHLILCHPLLLPPSIFSSIRVFSNESVFHIRWPKYWRFRATEKAAGRHREWTCGHGRGDAERRTNWEIRIDIYSLLCVTCPQSGFPGGSDGKASACNVGDLGSIPGLERSPGEGNGNPLQYSCLENPMDGRAW